MLDRNKALRRARGLYALMYNKNNEHEIVNAAARFEKIMLDHKFSMDEIVGAVASDVGEWDVPGVFNASWRMSMLTFSGQVHGCKAIRLMERESKGGVVEQVWHGKVIGRRDDADATIYAFRYYETAAREMCRESGYNLATEGDEESFMLGITYGIYKLVERQTKDRPKKEVHLPPTTKEMVPDDKKDDGKKTDARRYLEKKYLVREPETKTDRASNYDVFYSGYRAAQKIRLLTPDSREVMGLIEAEKKTEKKADEKTDERAAGNG